ncbi:MAG: hypothetical protein RI980_1663 [Bacteroidota bacterium]|jgi:hypothetical protein
MENINDSNHKSPSIAAFPKVGKQMKIKRLDFCNIPLI